MQVDYLVVGAGATAMAFVDVILSETEATVAIVDRRDAPGGHWNDAYPFVRLHQSSSFYGVPSAPLGQGRRQPDGINAGLPEMASKPEILHYYQELLEHRFLPTSRVAYYPQSEYLGEGRVRSLLTGEEIRLELRGKTVQAGRWGESTSIPATHTPSFSIAPGVAFGPVNDLARRAAHHESFTVIGAGKTGMDAICWLLGRGVDPERISWVRPNDYWLFNRDLIVPDPAFFVSTIKNQIAEMESLATASTVREHVKNLEASGRWIRIDPNCWPTKFHAAVCSEAEVRAMRRITNVIRMGHVLEISPEAIVLEDGRVPYADNRLFIDCTGRGGVILGPDAPPVFDGKEINTFMVRPFQPAFSAAFIAHLEATIADDEEKNALARVTDFQDTPYQYMAVQLVGMANQHVWNQNPELRRWIESCRLNAGTHLMAGLSPSDTEKMALLSQLGPLIGKAAQNLPRIIAAGDDAS